MKTALMLTALNARTRSVLSLLQQNHDGTVIDARGNVDEDRVGAHSPKREDQTAAWRGERHGSNGRLCRVERYSQRDVIAVAVAGRRWTR